MKELASGFGCFSNRNGWDDAKREALVRDCLFYVQTLDKQGFRTFICSVDMQKYREIKAYGGTLPSPYLLCNHWVPRQILKWFLERFDKWRSRDISYFFDQNERFKGPFELLLRQGQKKTRISNHWHLIKCISAANMRATFPLQLADLIAWGHHRKLCEQYSKARWSSLHVFTDAVLPFTRKDIDADQLDVMALYAKVGYVTKDYFGV
jgi:hypothetical protein